MVFNNEAQLRSFLLKKCEVALKKSQEQIYQIINRFVKEYYAEFSPEMYERTYQLYHSLVKSDIVPTGNGFEAQVYFDFGSLVYVTGSKPSGKEVMDAASYGAHGVEKVAYRGTGIWDDPKQILDVEAINILKRMLISEGIPIK